MYRRFKEEGRHKKMAAPPAPKVEYNYLGDSGLKVSNICLGTMTMGIFNDIAYFAEKPGQLNEKDSHALLDRFAELGGNFIDTADFYAAGGSERIVGTWLKKRERDRFVIATKCRFGWDPTDPNASGLSRKRIMSCVDNSLKRLQTDYIDLYQIHCWDYGVPIKETLLALNDLVRCGKVRYIGASNLSGWQLQKIVCLTEQLGLAPFISLQQQYNLLTRENEFEVFDVCENENIGILPWSPLKGGLLTGKYKRGQKAGGDTRLGWSEKTNVAPEYQATMKSDKYWELVDAMNAIAKTAGKTVPQVALRWALQRPNVPSALIGATKISQLEDNIGAASGWSLTDEQMEKLNGITEPTRPYPYNFIRAMNSQLLNAGKKAK